MGYKLADLLDLPALQRALDSLYIASGIPSAIIDSEGIIHTRSGWQDVCMKFHRLHPEAVKRCVESDRRISRHLKEADPSIVYRCPHGLVDTATPIVIEGEHLGNVFTGQLFLEEPDMDFFRAQARRYGFDEAAYIDAVKRVPVVREKALRENLAFLSCFTGMLAEAGLRQRREMEAERRLRESEERFRNIFRENSTVMLLSDPYSGRIEDANPAAARFYGYTEETLRTMRIGQINPMPEAELTAERMRALNREQEHFVFRHRLAGGGIRTVEVHSSPVNVGGRSLLFSIVNDITERRNLEERLRQSQKMEAVGRLAGGVAHDFNNLLTVILGYSESLAGGLEAGSPLRGEAEEIRRAAGRAAELTAQLLAFGRRQVLQPKVLDLNGVISRMEAMLRRLIGEDMDLRTLPGSGLWSVKVDPGQIEQVVMNLVINARDAMPGGGTITIETSNLYLDRDSSGDGSPPPGRYVQLAISDTGVGMDEATRARVFEPFFSTKELGKGTGLGLSTVYGIVEQSGGYVSVDSEAGSGSTFRVLFPRTEGAKPAAEGERRAPDGGLQGEGTILVAEDDESLRRLAVRVLERSGYRVLSAGDGEEALRVAAAHEGEIALLLTDVIMPRMGGGQLFERLRERRPGTRVIYMSGYTGEEIAYRAVMDSKAHFLQKPYTPDSLARKVKEILS